jgi:hypothetical protein
MLLQIPLLNKLAQMQLDDIAICGQKGYQYTEKGSRLHLLQNVKAVAS